MRREMTLSSEVEESLEEFMSHSMIQGAVGISGLGPFMLESTGMIVWMTDGALVTHTLSRVVTNMVTEVYRIGRHIRPYDVVGDALLVQMRHRSCFQTWPTGAREKTAMWILGELFRTLRRPGSDMCLGPLTSLLADKRSKHRVSLW
mmetsp:Transcript_38499/g.102420  ORF Transcript_38499/g.102420 Transcript_38499/m.102420 type:complete len:147 (+) Transcript_38499:270-710(+)